MTELTPEQEIDEILIDLHYSIDISQNAEESDTFVHEAKQQLLTLKKKWEQEAKTEEHYKTKYEILSKISSMHLMVDRQAFGENYTCDIMPYISKKLSDQLTKEN